MYHKPDGTPDDLAFMKDVENWPLGVMLPIKRVHQDGTPTEFGILVHRGSQFFFVAKTLGDEFGRDDLKQVTPEELADAGWWVD